MTTPAFICDAIPAVGGAMDLAIGAKKTYVMMEHTTKTGEVKICLLYTSPSPRDLSTSRMPSSA